MTSFENVMQVFALLDKSNCRKCGEKTCLAFAAAVFKGEKQLSDCPTVSSSVLEQYGVGTPKKCLAEERDDEFDLLRHKVASLDLHEAAARTGGTCSDDMLTLKVLGKDFSIDSTGHLYSSIHMNHWVTVPFLIYILNCRGDEVGNEWMSFREISGGKEKYPLFKKRCEEVLKQVADSHTDLFDDLVHLFQGRQVSSLFDSDISVVLPLLPKVPLAICYWKPDDGLASSLNVFFDRSVDFNLGADGAFSLGAGIAQMLEKITQSHGWNQEALRT